VENGDTLAEIARRYHTTAAAIAEANNLEDGQLAKDSRLIIPVSPAKSAAGEAESGTAVLRYSKHPTHYTAHRGDTVLSVADQFGIPAGKIRQWNHLKGNVLPAGRSLTIFKPSSEAAVEPATGAASRRRGRPAAAHATPQHGAHAPARSAGSASARPKAGGRPAAAARKEKASGSAKVSPARRRKRRQQD
jgi:membrane-bound lytic murein transglycosylase D